MSHERTIKELEQLKKELEERVGQIDSTITTLKSMSFAFAGEDEKKAIDVKHEEESVSSNNIPDKYQGYKSNASWRGKVLFILKREKRFIHIREVAEIIHKLEPDTNFKNITRKVSPAMSGLRSMGKVVKLNIGNSNINTFWGQPSWINEKGDIKEGYEYDSEQVSYGEELEA